MQNSSSLCGNSAGADSLATLESRRTRIAGFERGELLLSPGGGRRLRGRPRIRSGSSTPSLTGSILRAPGSRGSRRGDGAAGLCARRPAEALHLRLPQPGPLEPTARARVSLQRRGHRVAWRLEARLQDGRGLSARRSRGVSRRLPPVCAVVPAARPLRSRAAGGRWNPHQGGQQQRPQLHPLFVASVDPRRRRAVERRPRTARPQRRRRRGDKGRGAHQEPGRRSRRSARSAAVIKRCWPSSNEPARTRLTDPDSRAMAGHTKGGVGYNIQVAVDAKPKLIVEPAGTNPVVDMGLLAQTAEPAREISRRRDDRRRRRPRLLQGRGHRGLREGRLHPARSRTATRGSSAREGFFRKDAFR